MDLERGTIWLFLAWNFGIDSEKAIMTGKSRHFRSPWVSYSNDDGKIWAKPKELPHLREIERNWYAAGPGNAIQLTQGL